MKIKVHHHHRGIAGMFIAASLLYYFWLTSQHSSAAWLDCNTASSINVPVQECIGLIDLYNNMNGPTWSNNLSWDTDTNICGWYGVSCTNILGQDHVTQLTLNNNMLSGTMLPASMSGLTYLSWINLSNNTIRSSLPPEWAAWDNIRSFTVSYGNLTGSFPPEWSGWWDTIQTFFVVGNQIQGILPTEWDSRTNIENFDVQQNQLTGTLPVSWSTWGSISGFSISFNTIQGTLPTTWSSWGNIRSFESSFNSLTWGLPTERDTWTSLVSFDVSNNNLNGVLPVGWSTLTTLQSFSAGNNDFTETLPTSWSTRTNINQFYIGYNPLTGSLPSEWSTWTSIQSFDASASNIRGTLPASWSSWNSIVNFIASLNNITWSLPPEWSTWNNVQYFGMYANQLVGSFPESWSGMTSMRQFHISQNKISGPLPSSWSTWTGLLSFQVSTNNIEGTLPSSWSTWTNVNDIRVTQNQLTGNLPASWSGMTNIDTIWLSNNLFIGEVPTSWTSLTTLYNNTWLVLDNNCLETNLPEPPASFVESKAGTWWESSQNLCDIQWDLLITKSNSAFSTGKIGNTYTYTIHYLNSGDSAISGVTIYDTLITGFSYDSATPSATIITGQEIAWNIWPLNPMQSWDITLIVSIWTSFSSWDNATNTATIWWILTDVDTWNNTATTSPITIIWTPTTWDLSIEKTSINVSATAGETISYSIQFTNLQHTSGNAPSAFTISDSLPTGLTYVSTDFGSLYDFTTGIITSGNDITWNFWNIDSDSTGLITVYAEIDGGVASWTLISNTASITGTIEDANWSNNISTANDVLVFWATFTGDLAVFKSSSHTGAYSGDIVTFTIVYINSGESLVTGISLLDIMSPDLLYLTSSIAPDIVTGDVAYTSFYWYLTSWLAAHSSWVITMEAQVMTWTSWGSLRNSIQIESPTPTDIDNDNNLSSVSFTFLAPEDINGDSFSTPNNEETRSYAGPGGWDIPRITYHTITGESWTNSTGIVELWAPTLLDDETCMYNDGDFKKFKTTFKDIQNSVFKPAVDIMLDYCLVQWEYNQWKMFGVYNYLKWGEAYKIFGRLAWVEFKRKSQPTHWSDTYRFAGMKLNLWASTTSQPHNPKSYISYADIFTIGNNILRYYKKPPLEYDPTLNYNNAISRGKFALFIAQLITTIKQ